MLYHPARSHCLSIFYYQYRLNDYFQRSAATTKFVRHYLYQIVTIYGVVNKYYNLLESKNSTKLRNFNAESH